MQSSHISSVDKRLLYSWPTLTVRYALVVDVGLSVVRPSVVVRVSKHGCRETLNRSLLTDDIFLLAANDVSTCVVYQQTKRSHGDMFCIVACMQFSSVICYFSNTSLVQLNYVLTPLNKTLSRNEHALCLKKARHFYFCNNFDKCRPILIISSLLYSQIYC